MKITEDVRKDAAEHGVSEEGALKKGMEEETRDLAGKGGALYARG
ncbi:MAG TPA: hypothetical protein PK640_16380 [Verrucomicrobiota bacterium]|nr:hypothetical protein [Verrucomicrobiota bacterium]